MNEPQRILLSGARRISHAPYPVKMFCVKKREVFTISGLSYFDFYKYLSPKTDCYMLLGSFSWTDKITENCLIVAVMLFSKGTEITACVLLSMWVSQINLKYSTCFTWFSSQEAQGHG